MKKLYIVGAGGFGREVLWLVKRINNVRHEWDVAGFLDDNESLWGSVQDECAVLGGCTYLEQISEEVWVVVAIAAAQVKRVVVNRLSKYQNVNFATLIDPSVLMSDRVTLGEGCIICAGAILTVDIIIGRNVIIDVDCTVGHDDIIGDYVTAYPSVNISGNVIIGEEVELGTGMQVIQGKKIGKRSIIGAGAVVIRDIPERCTAVGCPAKPVKFFD